MARGKKKKKSNQTAFKNAKRGLDIEFIAQSKDSVWTVERILLLQNTDQ